MRFAESKGFKKIGNSGGHSIWSNGKGRPVPIPTHGTFDKGMRHKIWKEILAAIALLCAAGVWVVWNACPPGLYEVYLAMVR